MGGMSSIKSLAGAAVMALGLASGAQALPSLQLGPGPGAGWAYDAGTQTWVLATGNGTVNAFANDDTAGANGSYAWDAAGAAAQIAYLVVSAMPSTDAGDGDAFNVTVSNDGGALGIYTQGYGTPPIEDPNSIAPHGIFATWFEVYEFNFDGAVVQVSDQQPNAGAGTGDGFMEAFDVNIISLASDVTGIHFDLFTVSGDGQLVLLSSSRSTVNAFAPFSHDAEFGCCGERVPEPGPLGLLGAGMIALYITRRRHMRS